MISVIMPVYNAEKYLQMTVGSVLAQTYMDFELLLVDDGSTDSSPRLCDDFAAKDKRVRVFHKENGGTCSARNFGLDHACGEYVTFCDNDDYFYPDNLEVMHREIQGRDVIVCNYFQCMRDDMQDWINKPHDNKEWGVDIKDEASIRTLWPKFDFDCIGQVWHQMFRRDIIEAHNIRFDTLGYEDSLFSYEYYLYIKSAKMIGFAGYLYLHTSGSQSRNHKIIIDLPKIKRLAGLHEEFIRKHGIADRGYILNLRNRFMLLASAFILKGYFKDTRMPFHERITRWKELRKDAWFPKLEMRHLTGARRKLIYAVCKTRAELLADPFLKIIFDFI